MGLIKGAIGLLTGKNRNKPNTSQNTSTTTQQPRSPKARQTIRQPKTDTVSTTTAKPKPKQSQKTPWFVRLFQPKTPELQKPVESEGQQMITLADIPRLDQIPQRYWSNVQQNGQNRLLHATMVGESNGNPQTHGDKTRGHSYGILQVNQRYLGGEHGYLTGVQPYQILGYDRQDQGRLFGLFLENYPHLAGTRIGYNRNIMNTRNHLKSGDVYGASKHFRRAYYGLGNVLAGKQGASKRGRAQAALAGNYTPVFNSATYDALGLPRNFNQIADRGDGRGLFFFLGRRQAT